MDDSTISKKMKEKANKGGNMSFQAFLIISCHGVAMATCGWT